MPHTSASMTQLHQPVVKTGFIPRVSGQTSAQAQRIDSLMKNLEKNKIYVPDFQRDSSQWDPIKKSLLIESIINGLAVPPIILCPSEADAAVRELIDGQQRLTTIEEFLHDKFALAGEDEAEYSENVAPHIAGRTFSQLAPEFKNRIEDYELAVLTLPVGMDRGIRLEVFRRINEGGVPLTAQDLRLSTFGNSPRVTFVRLAGIFAPDRDGSARMILAARSKHDLDFPWLNHVPWSKFWADTAYSIGQNPSQMFLWYLIASSSAQLDQLLQSPTAQKAAGVMFDGTSTAALDLYCAQLQREDTTENAAKVLPATADIKELFTDFETWFNAIKSNYVPSISANSSTKIAFAISALRQIYSTPSAVTMSQWDKLQVLLTEGPTKVASALAGHTYSQTRGKWKGQIKQINDVKALCALIHAKY